MSRRFWIALHRYAGIYMVVFLVVAGLTGSILAFDPQISDWLNPAYSRLPLQNRPMLDPLTLRERALAIEPHARIDFVELGLGPGEVSAFFLVPKTDPATGKPYKLITSELYMNPYTGKESARIDNPDGWPLQRATILRAVFALHCELGLGRIGGILFGVAALIWTLDCFVGFYLTLPRATSHDGGDAEGAAGRRPWWRRWSGSWRFVWRGKPYRINYSLHRALGLWLWPLLFIFAVSSVNFNLPEVYEPVMRWLFHSKPMMASMPAAEKPVPDPKIGWREAAVVGNRLAEAEAKKHGFKLHEAVGEIYFMYDPDSGTYSYAAHGDRDIGTRTPSVTVVFDGNTGALMDSSFARGVNAGDTFTNWTASIHGANVGGMPGRIAVAVTGLLIPVLSIGGIYLWWVKRRTRRSIRAKCIAI
jgi:uncharacterized iron-regulated membrane protein